MDQEPRGTVMQVAHVVRDLEASVAHWAQTFGAGPFFAAPFRYEGHLYRGQKAQVNIVAAIGCLGSTLIELVQPQDEAPSIFNEVLQRRGEGLHHYWLKSDDFDGELARYAAAGSAMVGYGEMPDIGRTAFVDTFERLGCFVELCELTPKILEVLDSIRRAHRDWDGRDPIRPYPSF